MKIALAQGSESDVEDEFGDVLFSCVNIARFINVDSEEALTASTDKFLNRYALVEKLADEQGIDKRTSSIDTLDSLWNKAKEIIAEKAKTEEI